MSCGKIVVTRIAEAEELSVEWQIPNFPSLNHETGNYYHSPTVKFCDYEWSFKLWPNKWIGELSPTTGWTAVGLIGRSLRPGHNKNFQISLSIKGSRGLEKEKKREWSKNDSFFKDFGELCSRSEIMENRRRLMPRNVLIIWCVMQVPVADREVNKLQKSHQSMLKSGEDKEVALKEQGLEELTISLKRLLASGEDSDCLIKVQGKAFPAHRAILRARSPVFQAMFTHDMAEKQSKVVTMEDCDAKTFPAFLQHVYTGGVDVVSNENVLSLYAVSDKYDLKTLKKACAAFAAKNLTVASFCDVITLAIRHGDEELKERATDFFCGSALDIVQSAGWKTFLAENPEVGNELYIKRLKDF